MQVAAYPGTSENTGSQIFCSCGKKLAGDSLWSWSIFMHTKFIKSGK